MRCGGNPVMACPLISTAPADDPVRRIDYVFATPDIHVLRVGRPRASASDHLAVWVDLAVP